MRLIPLILGLLVALVPCASRAQAPPSCTGTTTNGQTLSLTITSPLPGTTVTSMAPNCPPTVTVTGTAGTGLLLYDFYFVIDSSGSTGRCTGSDIDQDGITGFDDPFLQTCSDPGDSVLSAEVTAVRGLVATLSPATTRVAIIQFSFPEPGGRQLVVQSLTNDFVLVNLALDQVELFGSAGATDYGGALDLLVGEATTNGLPLTREQRAYFLSDGVPTYPDGGFGSEEPGDSQSAIDAADDAAAAGVVVNTFGVGFIPSVTQDPVLPQRCLRPPDLLVETSTLECVAIRTGGAFFASTNPADIIAQIGGIETVAIESVTVTNDANGLSVQAALAPDGTWTADLPVVFDVMNVLRAVVLADDGTTCEAVTDFTPICLLPLPPDCDAGGPYQAACTGASGATTIALDGTGSSDPEGGALTYAWSTDCPDATVSPADSATPMLILTGVPCDVQCTVSLTVTDPDGMSSSCTAAVAVSDLDPPSLAGCPSDAVVQCPEETPARVDPTASDACDPAPRVDYVEVVAGTPCDRTITRTWTATDACGHQASCSQVVTVRDTTPPEIRTQPALGSGCAFLWPPMHGYVDFKLSDTGIDAVDNCGPVTMEFTGCSSSQPENVLGRENAKDGGDGDSWRDCVISPDGQTLSLRAERNGACAPLDRRYSASIVVVDACGNRTESAPFGVCVYHDRGHRPPGPYWSANPGSNQRDYRPGTNGTYPATGCGTGCSMSCDPTQALP